MTDASEPIDEAQWLSAAEALRRVVQACGDESAAATMLLEWVKIGELTARVSTYRVAWEGGPITTAKDKLLSVEDWDQFEEIEPPAFKSGIAATTGWDSFARNTVTVRMTGLHFEERELGALLHTLPARREKIVPEDSAAVEDEPEWVSARDAVYRIMGATHQDAIKSLHSIIAYAKTGNVRARALVLTEETHRQGFSKLTREERNAPIPLWFWQEFTTYGLSALNWQNGVFVGDGFRDGKSVTIILTGVQFDARGLDILDPAPKPAAIEPHATSIGRSGRPAAGWWEDLIIDIFAKIHWGDLKPERQSHIEEAMQDWMAIRGLSASSSTVRKRARKLWEALRREGEN